MKVHPISNRILSNKQNVVGKKIAQPQFRGNAGTYLGIVAGGAAAVALAVTAAPVLVCAGPLLGILGGYAGDKAEEKLKNKNNNEE